MLVLAIKINTAEPRFLTFLSCCSDDMYGQNILNGGRVYKDHNSTIHATTAGESKWLKLRATGHSQPQLSAVQGYKMDACQDSAHTHIIQETLSSERCHA